MPSCAMRRRYLRRRWCKGERALWDKVITMVTFSPKVGDWRYRGEFKKTSGVLMVSHGGNKGELSVGPDIAIWSDTEYFGE